MPTPRRRSADTPRRGRRTTERDQPYSQETQEALEAFIGELAVMPPPVVLIFHGLLNGRSLDEIAAEQRPRTHRQGTPRTSDGGRRLRGEWTRA